jgi:hypothetical protein
MQKIRKPQFLSAALGPNLFIEVTEELYAIGEGDAPRFTCLPDVGLEAQRYGLSLDETLFFVRALALDMFQPLTLEYQRINHGWHDCVAAIMRGYYCTQSAATSPGESAARSRIASPASAPSPAADSARPTRSA